MVVPMSPDPLVPLDSPRTMAVQETGPGRGVPGVWKKIGTYFLVAVVCIVIGGALAVFPGKLVFAFVAAVASVVLVVFRPYLGLILYTLALFLRPAEIWPVLGPLHLERIIGVLTLVAFATSSWFRDGRLAIDWSRQTRWLGAFWLATFLSMPTSYWPTRSVDMAVEVLKIIAFYVMIVSLVNTRARFKMFVWLYIGIVVYFGVTSLHDYYSGKLMFAQGIQRVVGETSSSGDPNSLGATMASTIPLVLFMFSRLGPVKKVILLSSFMVCTWTIALSGSRASLLGFLGGILVVWMMSPKRIRNALIMGAVLVAGFVSLPEQYKERYETIGSSELDESSMGRINAWKAGARMMTDRPFVGVGVGCFAVAYAANGGTWLQPHSLYIQVPAEVGMIGTVTFFGFLFLAVRTNRKSRRLFEGDKDNLFEATVLDGMLAGFFVLAICGVFGHSMLRPTWYLFAALGQASYRIFTQDMPPAKT